MTGRYVSVRATAGDHRLVCFPWAGAGALPFRSWLPLAPPGVSLAVARLGGREDRLREPCPVDWGELITDLVDELSPALPFTLFGHCVGALIAFEVALELERRGGPRPERLVVVGAAPSRNAHEPSPGSAREAVLEVGMMSEEIVNNPALFSIFETSITADLRLALSYPYRPEQRLTMPVDVCVPSAAGDLEVRSAHAWSEATRGPVRVLTVPGRKLYPQHAWLALAATVYETTGRRGD